MASSRAATSSTPATTSCNAAAAQPKAAGFALLALPRELQAQIAEACAPADAARLRVVSGELRAAVSPEVLEAAVRAAPADVRCAVALALLRVHGELLGAHWDVAAVLEPELCALWSATLPCPDAPALQQRQLHHVARLARAACEDAARRDVLYGTLVALSGVFPRPHVHEALRGALDHAAAALGNADACEQVLQVADDLRLQVARTDTVYAAATHGREQVCALLLKHRQGARLSVWRDALVELLHDAAERPLPALCHGGPPLEVRAPATEAAALATCVQADDARGCASLVRCIALRDGTSAAGSDLHYAVVRCFGVFHGLGQKLRDSRALCNAAAHGGAARMRTLVRLGVDPAWGGSMALASIACSEAIPMHRRAAACATLLEAGAQAESRGGDFAVLHAVNVGDHALLLALCAVGSRKAALHCERLGLDAGIAPLLCMERMSLCGRESLCGTLRASLCGNMRESLCGNMRQSLCGNMRQSLCGNMRQSLCGRVSLAGAAPVLMPTLVVA